MKKISIFSYIAAALLAVAGCEPVGNGYDGTNYIYLETEGGKTTIWEQDETPLKVTATLTTALEADLSLTFALEGTAGVLELKGNPVTIKAGEKEASFEVVSLNADKLEAAANYTLKLDAATVLPEGVALKSTLQLAVTPVAVEALTDAQKAIIEAYKTAKGVDLSKFIGVVNVSTVITGTDPDTYEPLEPQTKTGKTVIALSGAATAEVPVLTMVKNAMGIEDYMYEILQSVTVKNDLYWFDEYSLPSYATLMNAINWNKENPELFTMSLGGIKFTADGIDFMSEFTEVEVEIPTEDTEEDEEVEEEEEEETYFYVPFEYSYTAYDRELAALAAGTLVRDVDWAYDATANPAYHLNNDYTSVDSYEGGNWIEASAEFVNGNLVFTFCVYACAFDGDYTRVVATYTPNN